MQEQGMSDLENTVSQTNLSFLFQIKKITKANKPNLS